MTPISKFIDVLRPHATSHQAKRLLHLYDAGRLCQLEHLILADAVDCQHQGKPSVRCKVERMVYVGDDDRVFSMLWYECPVCCVAYHDPVEMLGPPY